MQPTSAIPALLNFGPSHEIRKYMHGRLDKRAASAGHGRHRLLTQNLGHHRTALVESPAWQKRLWPLENKKGEGGPPTASQRSLRRVSQWGH